MVSFTETPGDSSTDAERFGRRNERPDAGATTGDGLATVTYLPGIGGPRESDQDDAGSAEAEPASPEVVEAALVRALARRALSEREVLEQATRKYELAPDEAHRVLDRLRELGYVDDRVLAEQLRHSLYERKHQSRAVVARAMTSRGIDNEIVDEILDDVVEDDEYAQAMELAVKRAATLSRLDDETAKRRLNAFLARRGYPGHIVRKAVDAAMSGSSGDVRFR